MIKLKPNRNKHKTGNSFVCWCPQCDCEIVEFGKKCPTCGLRLKNKKKSDLISLSQYAEMIDFD